MEWFVIENWMGFHIIKLTIQTILRTIVFLLYCPPKLFVCKFKNARRWPSRQKEIISFIHVFLGRRVKAAKRSSLLFRYKRFSVLFSFNFFCAENVTLLEIFSGTLISPSLGGVLVQIFRRSGYKTTMKIFANMVFFAETF